MSVANNPLVFADDRDTIEAARDYLAELVRNASLDGDAPRGQVLALMVLQGPLDHLAKKNSSLIVNPAERVL